MLKRLYFAWTLREWPWRVPKQVERIGLRRPPEEVFRLFRELHGLDPDTGAPLDSSEEETP